jgi:hypothetical protein
MHGAQEIFRYPGAKTPKQKETEINRGRIEDLKLN